MSGSSSDCSILAADNQPVDQSFMSQATPSWIPGSSFELRSASVMENVETESVGSESLCSTVTLDLPSTPSSPLSDLFTPRIYPQSVSDIVDGMTEDDDIQETVDSEAQTAFWETDEIPSGDNTESVVFMMINSKEPMSEEEIATFLKLPVQKVTKKGCFPLPVCNKKMTTRFSIQKKEADAMIEKERKELDRIS